MTRINLSFSAILSNWHCNLQTWNMFCAVDPCAKWEQYVKTTKYTRPKEERAFQAVLPKNLPPATKDHQCILCRKEFTDENGLWHHKREHSGILPYECLICGEKKSTGAAMYQHVKDHQNLAGKKEFKKLVEVLEIDPEIERELILEVVGKDAFSEKKCQVCDKAKEGYALTLHYRRHTEFRPFSCLLCGVATCFLEEMINHLTRHPRKQKLEFFKRFEKEPNNDSSTMDVSSTSENNVSQHQPEARDVSLCLNTSSLNTSHLEVQPTSRCQDATESFSEDKEENTPQPQRISPKLQKEGQSAMLSVKVKAERKPMILPRTPAYSTSESEHEHSGECTCHLEQNVKPLNVMIDQKPMLKPSVFHTPLPSSGGSNGERCESTFSNLSETKPKTAIKRSLCFTPEVPAKVPATLKSNEEITASFSETKSQASFDSNVPPTLTAAVENVTSEVAAEKLPVDVPIVPGPPSNVDEPNEDGKNAISREEIASKSCELVKSAFTKFSDTTKELLNQKACLSAPSCSTNSQLQVLPTVNLTASAPTSSTNSQLIVVPTVNLSSMTAPVNPANNLIQNQTVSRPTRPSCAYNNTPYTVTYPWNVPQGPNPYPCPSQPNSTFPSHLYMPVHAPYMQNAPNMPQMSPQLMYAMHMSYMQFCMEMASRQTQAQQNGYGFNR